MEASEEYYQETEESQDRSRSVLTCRCQYSHFVLLFYIPMKEYYQVELFLLPLLNTVHFISCLFILLAFSYNMISGLISCCLIGLAADGKESLSDKNAQPQVDASSNIITLREQTEKKSKKKKRKSDADLYPLSDEDEAEKEKKEDLRFEPFDYDKQDYKEFDGKHQGSKVTV